MNFIKRYALKKYIKHNIQFVYAAIICLIAIILAITALGVDQLTAFPKYKKTYCGWQEYTSKDTIAGVVSSLKYDKYCSSGNSWCDTRDAGQYWLGCGIGGIFLGLISIAFIAVYKYLSFLIYGMSSGCFMAAVIYWTMDNEYCWGKDTYVSKPDMGASCVLMIFACIVQFTNICVAFRIPPQLRK